MNKITETILLRIGKPLDLTENYIKMMYQSISNFILENFWLFWFVYVRLI